jgi:hypothetical protein
MLIIYISVKKKKKRERKKKRKKKRYFIRFIYKLRIIHAKKKGLSLAS